VAPCCGPRRVQGGVVPDDLRQGLGRLLEVGVVEVAAVADLVGDAEVELEALLHRRQLRDGARCRTRRATGLDLGVRRVLLEALLDPDLPTGLEAGRAGLPEPVVAEDLVAAAIGL